MSEEELTPVALVLEDIRARYEGLLSYRKMAIDAGLVENLVYKAIKHGTTPRPRALRALAQRWGRTAEEKVDDFRRLMEAAGYVVVPPSDERSVSHFEQLLIEIMGMDPSVRDAWAAGQLAELELSRDDDKDAASPGDEEAAV